MRAGQLIHRVTIQNSSNEPDEYGQPIPTWATFAERWAKIEPLQGRERFAAQQIKADVTHKITMRYLPGVKPSMRIVYRDRIFDIEASLNIDERNRKLEIIATERTDED